MIYKKTYLTLWQHTDHLLPKMPMVTLEWYISPTLLAWLCWIAYQIAIIYGEYYHIHCINNNTPNYITHLPYTEHPPTLHTSLTQHPRPYRVLPLHHPHPPYTTLPPPYTQTLSTYTPLPSCTPLPSPYIPLPPLHLPTLHYPLLTQHYTSVHPTIPPYTPTTALYTTLTVCPGQLELQLPLPTATLMK